ncbi:pyridoxal-phosphate dependent enzyme [Streptomyces sp. NPDC046727]|uniref:pyridoxal-phosphate dependent enzyme n=1 Tax=Streptomyces sp. NPDC046727 TaxID=3155373 RepID=UPI0033DD2F70
MAARRPAHLVGNTPVLWVDEPFAPPGRGFHAKLEGANPGGPKDRPALHMVREARRRGDLAPGAPIVESSSGTLGLGLALAGLTYGHPVTVVTDPGMEPPLLRRLTALGARVVQVTAPRPEGGRQEARRERVTELPARTPGAYGPDQYRNPDNVAAYRPLAAVFYQAGVLVGPLAGLALLAWDFGAVCTVAALVFAVLAVLQSRALPARPPVGRGAEPAWRAVAADWRTVAANRPFLLFAAAMSGSYVLAFQVYLALPLHARELFGRQTGVVTGLVFAASASAAPAGQLKLTAWAQRTLSGPQAVVCGLVVMGAAFLPLLPEQRGVVAGMGALTVCAVRSRSATWPSGRCSTPGCAGCRGRCRPRPDSDAPVSSHGCTGPDTCGKGRFRWPDDLPLDRGRGYTYASSALAIPQPSKGI